MPDDNPPPDYEMLESFQQALGRESSHCEACGRVVDGNDIGDFNILLLDGNVFTVENHVVLCRDCEERDDWKEAVRKKRAAEQPQPPTSLRGKARNLPNTIHDYLTDPTARFLFARRLGVLALLLVGILLLLPPIAAVVGTLFVSPDTGMQWFDQSITAITAVRYTSISTLAWAFTGLFGIVYFTHIAERERNDPTGWAGEWNPPKWYALAVYTAIGLYGAVMLILVAVGDAPAGRQFGAGILWFVGSLGIAYQIKDALRLDLVRMVWEPRRELWEFPTRYGFVLALTAVAVGPPASLPMFTTPLLTALTPTVSTAYIIARLPHDRVFRDKCIDAQDRLLEIFRIRDNDDN
ncbi:hypothetical protein C457_10986 [Haloferax prahovense DSM 18310]|uniref:Uncharacterized protein n=1 Tax=Haloferax prahovense (strain DSM 18310 / JCM 13924 / TL6) TaxID=1227461 RepID=M0G918_HALPT|nr:hypothetical protein [Haloferax prahovense]ELZ68781.1 hypothetical protein C457_10986 [Haloferax prahovense DSM 18310]